MITIISVVIIVYVWYCCTRCK